MSRLAELRIDRRGLIRGAAAGAAIALAPRLASASAACSLDGTCNDTDIALQALIADVDVAVSANCGLPNRLDCTSLLLSGQVESFRSQLHGLEDDLEIAFCQAGLSESELIACAGLDADFPSLVSYYQANGLSFSQLTCEQVPVTSGPGQVVLVGSLLGAAWLLRRRTLGAAAVGAAVLADPRLTQAQDLQLVDLLETVLLSIVPTGTDVRCAARILAIVIEQVVPVNAALEFAEALDDVKNDPDVQTALNALLTSLNIVIGQLIDLEIDAMKDAVKDTTQKLADLLTVLDDFPDAKGKARKLAKGIGKRIGKCLGVIFLAVDAVLTIIDEWANIRADC